MESPLVKSFSIQAFSCFAWTWRSRRQVSIISVSCPANFRWSLSQI